MTIIKFIMLGSIMILSILIGRYISKQYLYRVKELKEIKNTLNIFKNKIRFTYEPIRNIFYEISNNTSYNVSKLYRQAIDNISEKTAEEAWTNSVDNYSGNLKKEDKDTLKMLSKMLRTNRCRGTNKSNRTNRKIFRRTDKKSRRRKK